MKAVMALTPGKLTLGELEIPTPSEYDALVKLDACAICNSTDHKLMTNEFLPGTFPIVLGHESISTVVSVGAKVKNFKPGDRVFRQRLSDHHVPSPGRSCWGGFAEYGLVTDEWARQGLRYGPETLPHDQQKLLVNVEPSLASGMITLMETLDCVTTCGVREGLSVAVVGSGPVAQSFAMFARLLDAAPVFAFGRSMSHASRFAMVSHCDGYIAGTSYTPEVARMLRSGGFELVIEAVGSPEALDTAITLAGTRGQVCVYGVAPKSNPYRQDQMNRPNVKSVGAREGRAQARLVQMIETRDVRLEDWITHTLLMREFQIGFDLLAQRQAEKVALLPG